MDYRPYGVILKVTPVIFGTNDIQCNITVEVSAPSQNPPSNTDVSIDIAHIETTATVHVNETIVLGGLSADMRSKLKSGIPYLKSVPILSFLVSDKNTFRDSEDLVIVMTPHVSIPRIEKGNCNCTPELASASAIKRINEEKNIWEKDRCSPNKVDRMENTRDYLTLGEVVDLKPLSISPKKYFPRVGPVSPDADATAAALAANQAAANIIANGRTTIPPPSTGREFFNPWRENLQPGSVCKDNYPDSMSYALPTSTHEINQPFKGHVNAQSLSLETIADGKSIDACQRAAAWAYVCRHGFRHGHCFIHDA